MSQQTDMPSPQRIFDTISAYQRTAALRAAIELDVFTAIAEGSHTAAEIAHRCSASERGTRILCDYLTVHGFLHKPEGRYELAADSKLFLDRRSPAYMGGVMQFLLHPTVTRPFEDVAALVRRGTTTLPGSGTVEDNHPLWVEFARGMAPMMRPMAHALAGFLGIDPPDRRARLLDVAAGHGLFGITAAVRHPSLEVFALDWDAVLAVAEENARAAGVAERFHKLPGSAFDIDLGSGYDVVLLTNFLHHFDAPTNVKLLRRVREALVPGGRVLTLEFIPNPDRVSPPGPAAFSLQMLAATPAGDAYPFAELDDMFRSAGFSRSELVDLQPLPDNLVISHA